MGATVQDTVVAPGILVHGPAAVGPLCHCKVNPDPELNPLAESVTLAPEQPFAELIVAVPLFGIPAQGEAAAAVS
ncbi:MAG: hypothetical protein EBV59_04605 [Synechococcaceae bacterium WB7_1C_051]|nr:hypothetical protein [Synechococcaceae bacterium WB7_1C_051]